MLMPGRDRVTQSVEPGHRDMDTAEYMRRGRQSREQHRQPITPDGGHQLGQRQHQQTHCGVGDLGRLDRLIQLMPSREANSWASA